MGLYLLKTNKPNTKKNISVYYFLTLVKANRSNFTTRQLKQEDKAKEFRKKIGYLGYRKYFKFLKKQYFRSCPIAVEDAKRGLYMHGPDVRG